jgi:hypothetical protein
MPEAASASSTASRWLQPGSSNSVVPNLIISRGVDDLAQRRQRLPALRHRALGTAQQVPVPVDQAGDDDAARLVDQRGRPVLRQDRGALADLGDDPTGHRDRAVPVDLALGVERNDPLAGDDGVDVDWFGALGDCHRPLPRVWAGVPSAAAGAVARCRQTR